MQLKHLRLEIFLTFSWGFWVFEAHLLTKIFLIKKNVYAKNAIVKSHWWHGASFPNRGCNKMMKIKNDVVITTIDWYFWRRPHTLLCLTVGVRTNSPPPPSILRNLDTFPPRGFYWILLELLVKIDSGFKL